MRRKPFYAQDIGLFAAKILIVALSYPEIVSSMSIACPRFQNGLQYSRMPSGFLSSDSIDAKDYSWRTLVSIRRRVARRVHARDEKKMYPIKEDENTKLKIDSRLDPTREAFALSRMLRAPRAAPR